MLSLCQEASRGSFERERGDMTRSVFCKAGRLLVLQTGLGGGRAEQGEHLGGYCNNPSEWGGPEVLGKQNWENWVMD